MRHTFFDLLGELRNKIYRLSLVHDDRFVLFDPYQDLQPKLLQTSSRIRSEALVCGLARMFTCKTNADALGHSFEQPIFYGENIFRVAFTEQMNFWLAVIGTEGRTMLKEAHLHVLSQMWLHGRRANKIRRYPNILHSSHGNYMVLKYRDDIPDDQLLGEVKVAQRKVTVQTNRQDCLETWRNDTGKKRKFNDAFESPMHARYFGGTMNAHYETF